jgi:ankyrin repeat protein
MLLEKGADLAVPDNDGWTPLNAASDSGHIEVVKLLLEEGADHAVQINDGWTPLNNASANGHIKVVGLLLEEGADHAVPNNGGWTPLNTASRTGHIEVVKLLLEKGADLAVPNTDGITPLYSASSKGHVSIVELLLDKGADFEVVNGYHQTPLHGAAFGNAAKTVNLLLQRGAPAHARDVLGRTPIFYAIRSGCTFAVDALLATTDMDINGQDLYGSTALSLIARCGRETMMTQVMSLPYIDPSLNDHFGRSPLWWAQKQGSDSITKRLLNSAKDLGSSMAATSLPTGNPALFHTAGPYCDVCLAERGEVYYHCSVCLRGDIDICSDCQRVGAHCFVKSHILQPCEQGSSVYKSS